MLVTGEIKSANSYHEKAIDSMTTFYRIFFWFGFGFLFCSLLTIRLFCRAFFSLHLYSVSVLFLFYPHRIFAITYTHIYSMRQRQHDSEDGKQVKEMELKRHMLAPLKIAMY